MTVAELRAALEGLNDDAEVFVDWRGYRDEPVLLDGVGKIRIYGDMYGVVICDSFSKDRNYDVELVWEEP